MKQRLSADYWIARDPRAHVPILDADEVGRFNAIGFERDPHLADLAHFPDRLEKADVLELMNAVSKPYSAPLHHSAGGEVGPADYQRYRDNMNLKGLPGTVVTRFGLVLKRTDMRSWPNADTAYKNQETRDLDRFQENGLFPGQAVAVLHDSTDGEWCFVHSYNYAAWVRCRDIGLAGRDEVNAYGAAGEFIVVTGSKVTSNFNPHCAALSELQFDMGVKLPLAGDEPGGWPGGGDIDGQNPYTSWAVRLPVRDQAGGLGFRTGLIARSQDVSPDYLPYTRANIIRQGFKFLGERYGWGHSYNARDCSGLVTEVFRSCGVLLPRNTRQQVDSPMGQTLRFSPVDNRERRLQALQELQPGDLVYSPGHVMIYVGRDGQECFVLHDTSSRIRFDDGAGGRFEGILNGVSVTPLLSLQDANGRNYVDDMLAIKKIY